jgi:hypothetical protein
LEILVVATLVGTDRDSVRVFLDRGANDVRHAAVVPQVNHFCPMSLQEAPDHIDRSVVAIEQRRRGNEAQRGLGRGLLRFEDRTTSRLGTHAILRASRMTTGEYDPILTVRSSSDFYDK